MPESDAALDWLGDALGDKPQSTQHIAGPKSDRPMWETAAEGSEAINSIVEQTKQWPAFQNLLQDTFNAYYKLQPELSKEHQVATSHKGNRPYVERLLEEGATAHTRAFTQLDELASAVTTLETGRALRGDHQEQEPRAEHEGRHPASASGTGPAQQGAARSRPAWTRSRTCRSR